jgi:hypothetical protein
MVFSARWAFATFLSFSLVAAAGFAQNPSPDPAQPVSADAKPATPAAPQEDKRIFGVLPNNRTTEGTAAFVPISAGRKMTIAAKDSFDWPVIPTSAAFAALYQLENQNPSFGQGMSGYAKRFATAYGDQMIGNMMTEGIVPALTHEDPRYFRVSEGTKMHRLKESLLQILVTRTDSGGRTFNLSEWGGNAAATAISNAYYPDTRTVHDNVQKWMISVATDTFSDVAKEFWPDVKRALHRHKGEAILAAPGK